MPLYLVPEGRDDGPVPVDRPVLFFGRHAGCDVIITCSRKVSRRHCCLAQIHDSLVVRDLGSMNGVRVGGTRIKGEAKLRRGETLVVGDVPFKLTEGQFDVPKGKVTIGPPPGGPDADAPAGDAAAIDASPKRPKSEAAPRKARKRNPNAVEPPAGFRGLKSSRPNRGSGKSGPPPRPAATPDSAPELDAFSMNESADSGAEVPIPPPRSANEPPKKRRPVQPQPQPPAKSQPPAPPASDGSVDDILFEADDEAPDASDSFGSADLEAAAFLPSPQSPPPQSPPPQDPPPQSSPPPRPQRPPAAAESEDELPLSDLEDLDSEDELDLGGLEQSIAPGQRPAAVEEAFEEPLPASNSGDSIIELSEFDLLD